MNQQAIASLGDDIGGSPAPARPVHDLITTWILA